MNGYAKFQIIFVAAFFIYAFAFEFSRTSPTAMPIANIIMASLVYFYGFNGFQSMSSFLKKREERITAIKQVKEYLKPYKKLFGDFCLINKHCSITYINDKMIFGFERGVDGQSRTFKAEKNGFVSVDIGDFFNIVCSCFDADTTFDYMFNMCRKSNSSMGESEVPNLSKTPLVCINTCSEDEITDLPGVSVVMAKKAIRHREEAGGFKSVDEFIEFLHIKHHFAEQIRTLVVAAAVKPPKKQEKPAPQSKERIVDI